MLNVISFRLQRRRVLHVFIALSGGACGSSSTPEPPSDDTLELAGPSTAGGQATMVYSAGLDALLADDRDANLHLVLSLVGQRLPELAREFGLEHPPPGSLELLWDLLRLPFCLSLDPADDEDGARARPSVQLSVCAKDSTHVDSLSARVEALLASALPAPTPPVEERPGLKALDSPFGRLFFGRAGDPDVFVLALGEPRSIRPQPGRSELPTGTVPLFAMSVDTRRLQKQLERLLAFDANASNAVRDLPERLSVLGEDPVSVTFALGHAADRSRWAFRSRRSLGASGVLASGSSAWEELRLVPRDATRAILVRVEPRTIVGLLGEIYRGKGKYEKPTREFMDELRSRFGIELEADVLEPLGTHFGFYLSDTTGSGGVDSAVCFASVEDEARLRSTLAKLSQAFEELGDKRFGKMRARALDLEGTSALALSLPGLPFPLKPTLAISRGRLFAAATPQALQAALEHAGGSDPGLLAHPSLRSSELGSLDDFPLFSFADPTRLAEDGTNFVELIFSAIANAVCPPAEGTRDPGAVLTPFRELLNGARPTIQLTRIEGEDLVTVGEGDLSVTANVCALFDSTASQFGGTVMTRFRNTLDLPPVAKWLPPAEQARADIKILYDTAIDYAIEHGGRDPDSLEDLVTPDEDGFILLDADGVPRDPWGNEYGYTPAGEGRRPRIFTLGADGLPGGEGADKDIDNFELSNSPSSESQEEGD